MFLLLVLLLRYPISQPHFPKEEGAQKKNIRQKQQRDIVCPRLSPFFNPVANKIKTTWHILKLPDSLLTPWSWIIPCPMFGLDVHTWTLWTNSKIQDVQMVILTQMWLSRKWSELKSDITVICTWITRTLLYYRKGMLFPRLTLWQPYLAILKSCTFATLNWGTLTGTDRFI